jgi:hypothetical protein
MQSKNQLVLILAITAVCLVTANIVLHFSIPIKPERVSFVGEYRGYSLYRVNLEHPENYGSFGGYYGEITQSGETHYTQQFETKPEVMSYIDKILG